MTAPDLSILEALPPDERRAAADALFESKGEDYARMIALWGRGQLARQDNLEGFQHFYWCLYGRELPEFQYPWYEAMQAAWLRRSKRS